MPRLATSRSDFPMHAVDIEGYDSDAQSDGDNDGRFACCILWTPIHPITWFVPFVGHLGICDSKGRLHDWGGGPIRACAPRGMMFGEPARYIQMRPADVAAWDDAIAQADEEYRRYMHCMLFGHDCHSHVARVLNILRVGGCTCHNKVVIAATVFFFGRHTGVAGCAATWVGFALLLMVYFFVHGSSMACRHGC
jgi:hypothetical protein